MWQSMARPASLRDFFSSKFDVSKQHPLLRPPEETEQLITMSVKLAMLQSKCSRKQKFIAPINFRLRHSPFKGQSHH